MNVTMVAVIPANWLGSRSRALLAFWPWRTRTMPWQRPSLSKWDEAGRRREDPGQRCRYAMGSRSGSGLFKARHDIHRIWSKAIERQKRKSCRSARTCWNSEPSSKCRRLRPATGWYLACAAGRLLNPGRSRRSVSRPTAWRCLKARRARSGTVRVVNGKPGIAASGDREKRSPRWDSPADSSVHPAASCAAGAPRRLACPVRQRLPKVPRRLPRQPPEHPCSSLRTGCR